MFVLYWFFQYYFCFSKLHTTLKTSWKYKHSFVSCSCHSFTNSKLCMLNSSKIFTRLWYGSNIETLSRKICEFFWIQNWWNYIGKSSLFLFSPAPWVGTPATTSLKPWIWWNIWIIWSSSYGVSSGNQNWSWLRIVSYQSWFVTAWSPKLPKEFLKKCKKWKN